MSRYSTMSLDPQFREAWEKALTEPLTIRLESKRDAYALRHKLYQARKIIEAQDEDFFKAIVHLSIIHEYNKAEGAHLLTIKPAMRSIKAALGNALGKPTEAPDFEEL